MDVLVHLSLREGLPRTVVQALASGKPAVGFDLDGTPEVILHGDTGLLCPPGDATSVGDAVLGLLRDKGLAADMGAKGRELVAEKFDWRRMVQRLDSAYKRLSAATPHPRQ
jgi:glycosyltransferase involved in cell wall biosynthesis